MHGEVVHFFSWCLPHTHTPPKLNQISYLYSKGILCMWKAQVTDWTRDRRSQREGRGRWGEIPVDLFTDLRDFTVVGFAQSSSFLLIHITYIQFTNIHSFLKCVSIMFRQNGIQNCRRNFSFLGLVVTSSLVHAPWSHHQFFWCWSATKSRSGPVSACCRSWTFWGSRGRCSWPLRSRRLWPRLGSRRTRWRWRRASGLQHFSNIPVKIRFLLVLKHMFFHSNEFNLSYRLQHVLQSYYINANRGKLEKIKCTD